MADIAEALDHNITTGAITFDQFFRTIDHLSIYASGQQVKRDSYYGAEQSLSDYGYTQDFSFVVGAQYRAAFNNSSFILGLENDGARLTDRKLAHFDLDDINFDEVEDEFEVPIIGNRNVADQTTNTFAAFAQYEIDLNRLNISAGARFNNYQITDAEKPENDKSGNIITPRITMKYDIRDYFQARVSYAQGYRAPQIFDEDLHIETSAARQIFFENDPDLEAERSESFMASFDYTNLIGNTYVGLLVEGFHTRLHNAFASEFGDPEEGELREPESFLDLGVRLSHSFRFNGNTFQVYAGMKNIFNAYQKDFDTGIDRDPGYIYGPIFPRTIFFGVKLGNFIR